HPEFRVSAYTADGRVFGLVAPSGDPADESSLEFRAASYRDTLATGTLVLSSGLGGVYPKGIPVGTVAGIAREQEGWERVYWLRPAANPGAVAHVMVLGAGTAAVAEAFPAESILAAVRADSLRREALADSLLRVRIADSVRAVIRDSLVRAGAGPSAGAAQAARPGSSAGRTAPAAARPPAGQPAAPVPSP
ncbi:MAG TPA: rod shape-determining protein MreC, partial [Gemmatimonadales bacterium]|nr:rod shape-determining protein MreC [Gemmatimonadales bacterium]